MPMDACYSAAQLHSPHSITAPAIRCYIYPPDPLLHPPIHCYTPPRQHQPPHDQDVTLTAGLTCRFLITAVLLAAAAACATARLQTRFRGFSGGLPDHGGGRQSSRRTSGGSGTRSGSAKASCSALATADAYAGSLDGYTSAGAPLRVVNRGPTRTCVIMMCDHMRACGNSKTRHQTWAKVVHWKSPVNWKSPSCYVSCDMIVF